MKPKKNYSDRAWSKESALCQDIGRAVFHPAWGKLLRVVLESETHNDERRKNVTGAAYDEQSPGKPPSLG